MTEIISGLHTCKPSNAPKEGETKYFFVDTVTSRGGKAYTKIKRLEQSKGGMPYRIVSVRPTDYVDAHGNTSFNLDLEPLSLPASGAGGQPGASHPIGAPSTHTQTPASAPPPKQSNPVTNFVVQPKETVDSHLDKATNLYCLCIGKVDTVIREYYKNNAGMDINDEQFQSAVASLFIEASHKRTDDGVNWYSFIDHTPEVLKPKEETLEIPF